MFALKLAIRGKNRILRTASYHSKVSNVLPTLRRSMDGQPSLVDNNCRALRRRAQMESTRDSTQPLLGDFDNRFYRSRYNTPRPIQRTWAELETSEGKPEVDKDRQDQNQEKNELEEPKLNNEPAAKCSAKGLRYDDVNYDPKPMKDRKIQCTWHDRYNVTYEDESEMATPSPKKKQRPEKRISKQRMAASSYISQMLSNQDQNMKKNYECGLRGNLGDMY